MYSNNDFERFFIRYKAESVTSKESIQSFCFRNKVPYNLFARWYKDTRHKLVPVQVDGQPQEGVQRKEPIIVPSKKELRILVDIHISNGMHIRQYNLSYEGLKSLVEKLEALC